MNSDKKLKFKKQKGGIYMNIHFALNCEGYGGYLRNFESLHYDAYLSQIALSLASASFEAATSTCISGHVAASSCRVIALCVRRWSAVTPRNSRMCGRKPARGDEKEKE